MRNGILLILALAVILLAGLGFFYVQRTTRNVIPSPSSIAPSPIASASAQSNRTIYPAASASYCSPQDLQANLTLSPGAGNVYGTFTLKNISSSGCQILGGNFIAALYGSSIKNISISQQGQTQPQPFNLSPGQTLYSQVHYPNGPQCQGPTQSVPVTFNYKISPTELVTFKTQGDNAAVVQDCQSPSEITQIQIWEMSPQPITPQ